jgi:hypothetical protein
VYRRKIGPPRDKKRAVSSRLSVIAFDQPLVTIGALRIGALPIGALPIGALPTTGVGGGGWRRIGPMLRRQVHRRHRIPPAISNGLLVGPMRDTGDPFRA